MGTFEFLENQSKYRLAKKLKELRAVNNLSQCDLSKQVRINPITICKWENCETLPKIKAIIKLSNFFNVSVDYFI